ncbi:glutamine-rich protein 2-like isoform X2 [Macrobrachium nipponense]
MAAHLLVCPDKKKTDIGLIGGKDPLELVLETAAAEDSRKEPSQNRSEPTVWSAEAPSPRVGSPVVSRGAFSPTVFSSGASTPTVVSPGAFSPTVVSPGAFNPTVGSPGAFNPTVGSPGAFNPTVGSPGALSPRGAFNPIVGSPGALSPRGAFNPTVGSPGALSPRGAFSPTVGSPGALSPRGAFSPAVGSPEALSPRGAFSPAVWSPGALSPRGAFSPAVGSPGALSPREAFSPTVGSPGALSPRGAASPTIWSPGALSPRVRSAGVLSPTIRYSYAEGEDFEDETRNPVRAGASDSLITHPSYSPSTLVRSPGDMNAPSTDFSLFSRSSFSPGSKPLKIYLPSNNPFYTAQTQSFGSSTPAAAASGQETSSILSDYGVHALSTSGINTASSAVSVTSGARPKEVSRKVAPAQRKYMIKQKRFLEKKLHGIKKLERRVATGQTLTEEEKIKVDKKEEYEEELMALFDQGVNLDD